MSDVDLEWASESILGANTVDDRIEKLAELDIPLLYLEAVAVYDTHQKNASTRSRCKTLLEQLAQTDQITEEALDRWTRHELPVTLFEAIERCRALHQKRRASSHTLAVPKRLCCPLIFPNGSSLLPMETLSSVRWIEVIDKPQRERPAFEGFPAEWSATIGRLSAEVHSIVGPPKDGRAPQWRLLDSFGQSISRPIDNMMLEYDSFQLGAALAYAAWLQSLELNAVVAATGTVGDKGAIGEVGYPDAKLKAISRGVPRTKVLFAPGTPGNRKDMSDRSYGYTILHVSDLSAALEWLSRLSTKKPHHEFDANRRRFSGKKPVFLAGLGLGAVLGIGARSLYSREARAVPVPHVTDAGVDAHPTIADVGLDVLSDRPHRESGTGDSASLSDVALLDHSDVSAVNRDAQLDAPPSCSHLGANGVCMARLASPLFAGSWQPLVIVTVDWSGPTSGDRCALYRQSLAFPLPEDGERVPVTTYDGVPTRVHVPAPNESTLRGRYETFGSFYVCINRPTDVFDFCGGVNVAASAVGGDHSRLHSRHDVLPGLDFLLDSRPPSAEVVDVQMGLDVYETDVHPSTGSRFLGVRWASRGVSGPLRIVTVLPGGETRVTHDGLLAFGEVLIDMPTPTIGDPHSGGVCISGQGRRFVFCRRYPWR